jgi:hypothetical protein
MNRKTVAPIVLAAVALALAGCGSSSSNSSSSSSAASGADFVAKANALCSKINNQIAALPPITSSADILKLGPKEVSLANQGITEMKSLTAPSGQASAVNQYVAVLETQATLSTKLLAAFKAGDAVKLKQIQAQGKASQSQGHAQAVRLGLTQCARNVQPAGKSG